MSGEADERLPAGPQGERGAQGNQGNQGERGQLSRLQGRAVVVLFLLAALSSASGWFWQAHEARQAAAAQHAEQVAQQRQGAVIEAKLCATFGGLAARQAPGGSPADNPSRAYLQWLHSQLAQVAPDIDCNRR